MTTDGQRSYAVTLIRGAAQGEHGQIGRDLAAILQEGAKAGRAAQDSADRQAERADRLERDVWALSWVLAEIMDGKPVNDVIDDLPSDVRRRVIACRHDSGLWRGVRPQDQYGPLPTPLPRASVMRSRYRVIDVDDPDFN